MCTDLCVWPFYSLVPRLPEKIGESGDEASLFIHAGLVPVIMSLHQYIEKIELVITLHLLGELNGWFRCM